jgi:hypothetical protein
VDLPICSENMPYYRCPQVHPQPPSNDTTKMLHIHSLLTDIITLSCNNNTFLSNVPVHFGHVLSNDSSPKASMRELLNPEFASYTFQAVYFNWAVESFSNGHVPSTIQSRHLPFHISLACNTSELGRALFHEFTPNAKVFSTGNDFLNHNRASRETSVVHGYLINSYCFQTRKVTTEFWKL